MSSSRRAPSSPNDLRRGTGKRLSRLTDAEREVYVSVAQEGLRPAELARYSHRSESTIRTLLARARRRLGESET